MGILTEIHNFIEAEAGIVEATMATGISADENGPSVDLLGFNGAEVIVFVGTNASHAAGAYWNLELEESADDSTFTDVAEDDLIDPIADTTTGAFALIDDTTEDAAWFRVGYRGNLRYIRLVLNVTGSPGTTKFSAVVLKCGPSAFPTTNP